MGRPAINTVFNHGADKNRFNAGAPVNDWRDFGARFVTELTALGAADPNGLAHVLLPDILTYDTSTAAAFLNPRQLSHDPIPPQLHLITNGPITRDPLATARTPPGPLPYLAAPH